MTAPLDKQTKVITGNAAANVLDGGLGADTLIGGLGDDVYSVDQAGDTVVDPFFGTGNTLLEAYSLGRDFFTVSNKYKGGAWRWNLADQLESTTDALGRSVGYEVDPAGNRTAVKYPDGRVERFTFYANNWLRTMTDPQSGTTTYSRDGTGPRAA